jgi:hypothetical protein
VIYNKRFNFIFIKTRKTAGTSIEIELGKLRGPDDIITPINKDEKFSEEERTSHDEAEVRRLAASGIRPEVGGNFALGYLGAQNHLWTAKEIAAMKEPLNRAEKYWNHMPAHVVRQRLPQTEWERAFKFCVERNPWDKVLSAYWYLHKRKDGSTPGTLDDFIFSGRAAKFSCWRRYTDPKTDKLFVDRVLRYENLDAELAEVTDKLGMPRLDLPRAKGWKRQDRRHYSEVYTPEQRDRVAKDFANEIRAFGYSF